MQIPETIVLAGRTWRVLWRSRLDPTWARERCWGRTSMVEPWEIHLCDSLLARDMEAKRAEVWMHELVHAALTQMKGRAFSVKDEERAAMAIGVAFGSLFPTEKKVRKRTRRKR